MPNTWLYGLCFIVALILSAILTPLMRQVALRLDILDHPSTAVKTHKHAVPYLGGLAVAIAMAISLGATRLFTQFPTGTLHSLRGIYFGGLMVVLLGLADDATPRGLGYKKKFVIQFAAAYCLMSFDMRIKFISPHWLANALTLIWVVGIMNAVNIIDIMDGLASGIGVIASLGFLFISLPSEEIFVNFTASALAGSLMGFLPYNLSKSMKIFLGDTGSLLTGLLLAALSLGTSYTRLNNFGIFAPLLILGLPIYDTLLVTYLRLQKGMSPFVGSKDHFALRLEKFGFFREEILVLSYAMSLTLTFAAYQVTVVPPQFAMLIYAIVGIFAVGLGTWLARISIET